MNGSKSHGVVRRSKETELTSSGSSKRRKFDIRDDEKQCRGEIIVNSPEDFVSSPESSSNCDHVFSPSPCLKNDFSLDLKAELCFETVSSICSSDDGFSRETSSSNEMDSTPALKKKPVLPAKAATSCHKPTIMPSAAEIDEFFAQAEKKEQKRFADKYNYDIVKDVPMEGRYLWVRLKQ